MKQSQRFMLIPATVSTLSALAFIPATSGAQQQAAAKKAAGICQTRTQTHQAVTASIAKSQQKAVAHAPLQDARTNTRTNRTAQRLHAQTTQLTQRQSAEFARLQARAHTPAQKAAVQRYVATVTAANQAKQTAVITAYEQYAQSVSTANQQRRNQVTAHYASLSEAVDTAYTKNTCTGKPDGAASGALQADLATARSDYRTARQNDSTTGATVSRLTLERTARLRQIQAQHQLALKQARTQLNLALKNS